GPTPVASQANPLSDGTVDAGAYVVTAGAPTGFHFVDCGSGANLIGNPPTGATEPVTVPSGGTGTAIFFVVPNEVPPVQTLAGHIYDRSNGTTQSTNEEPGGTLSAAGPTTIAEQGNPLAATPVDIGQYLVSAGAPSGFHFVKCGTNATLIGNPASNATLGDAVAANDNDVVNFYVVPNEIPPTQTLAGHIYLCSSGSTTTTEVPNGTLSAAGPTAIAEQGNPLNATPVDIGSYVVSAGAPSGYEFVSCGQQGT